MASGAINNIYNSNDKFVANLTWTSTPNSSTNTSTVSITLKAKRTDSYTTTGTFKVWIVNEDISISSNTYTKSIDVYASLSSSWVTLASYSFTVKHSNAGYAQIALYGSIMQPANAANYETDWSFGLGTAGPHIFDLDVISRQATITAAPNFTDESNPTITYSNPAGTAVTTLQACISLTGSLDDIPYRDISKTGTSYTFSLTELERFILQGSTTNAKSRTVYFYIKTIMNGKTMYSKVAKTLTITNAAPTLSNISVTDGNEKTANLTGDNNVIIKGYSTMAANASYATKKAASLKSFSVTNSGKTLTTTPAIFEKATSDTFKFAVTDSRGYVTTSTVTKPIVNYFPVTVNLEVLELKTEGSITFKISGDYFNGSFGAADNQMWLSYKTQEGDYIDPTYTYVTPTIEGNKYSITVKINGVNYKAKHKVYVQVEDKLSAKQQEFDVTFSPVFDWGKNDFAFNVPVSFNAGIANGNKVLWQGGMYMNEDHTATLSEAISAQQHGIVLVFSGYSGGSLDSSINTFFVSKEQVSAFPNCGHTFILGINAGFSKMGAKYLYFTDTTVKGHAGNVSSGTNSGITFDNSYYVLRYVIGV